MLLIALFPLMRFEPRGKFFHSPNRYIFNFICILFIIPSIVQLPQIISGFFDNIFLLFLDDQIGKEIYEEAMDRSYDNGSGVSNLPAIITGAFQNIGFFLLFFSLGMKSRNKLIIVGLIISCFSLLLSAISSGQRGLIMEVVFSFVISFFAFRFFLSHRVRNYITFSMGLILMSVIFPIIALTNSRFESSKEGAESSVVYYLGQANLYFNNYAFDNGGIQYGDRTIPLFKRMVGINNVPKNFWERRLKYSSLKINDSVFVSFVGDFVFDYGPFLSVILFVFYSLFVVLLTTIRNKKIYIHQFLLLHFTMCVCFLGGLKSFTFADVGGNLQIILYFILIVFFFVVDKFDWTHIKYNGLSK